jgi:hypothetical protein
MGKLGLAWPCAGLRAGLDEFMRDGEAWGKLSKTPPQGSNPVGGVGCSYPPLPTNFLPFRNVAYYANACTPTKSPLSSPYDKVQGQSRQGRQTPEA